MNDATPRDSLTSTNRSFDEEFMTDTPPDGATYRVLRDEWIERPGQIPLRKILSIELVR